MTASPTHPPPDRWVVRPVTPTDHSWVAAPTRERWGADRRKPAIGLAGPDGIPLREEIELCLSLA